ncbi:MAG: NAD+ synthase [Sedimentisphaerales bacterium]|nr:NAD+ synthase [Sedimentisphaerales bacterium]
MRLRIGLGQINASVGDLQSNTRRIRQKVEQGVEQGASLVVFPEMSLSGYPPEDLLLKRHFFDSCRQTLIDLAGELKEFKATVLVGFPERSEGKAYNSLAVIEGGQVEQIYRKGRLPNYGVFDEKRYFEAGSVPLIIELHGLRIALTICEDIWELSWLDRFLAGAAPRDMIINISASPFHVGKIACREELISKCAQHFGVTLAYCNLVGGQDELVFDGRSMVAGSSGQILCQAKAFVEDLLIFDLNRDNETTLTVSCISEHLGPVEHDPVGEVYEALVLGARDYVRKNGFDRVLIGLSGGIDSSLTAAIAVEALGAENVVGITMPSRFNAGETISDAELTAKNLGMEFHTIPIAEVLDQFDQTLSRIEGWDDSGLAYENLQARIRGTILMSLSNQLGFMVLTTGNKSETAVGYSTLYGDTAGGFAVIRDVPKTLVYQLSRYVNSKAGRELIPESVIVRIPSAELRPNQKDSDSLPDYDLLDRVLKGYVEDDKSRQELLAEGLDEETVKRVIRLVDRNEYKRRQCPPGVKITPKAFGKDRRMPIVNRFNG